MKLQDQVCTLEQAKELNKLGVTQGASVFFYDTWKADKNKLQYNSGHQAGGEYKNAESCFSAFTSAELGIMLPDSITTNSSFKCADLIVRNEVNEWTIGYDYDSGGNYEANVKMYYTTRYGKTEAEAKAEMLIALLLINKTTVAEVNERLNA